MIRRAIRLPDSVPQYNSFSNQPNTPPFPAAVSSNSLHQASIAYSFFPLMHMRDTVSCRIKHTHTPIAEEHVCMSYVQEKKKSHHAKIQKSILKQKCVHRTKTRKTKADKTHSKTRTFFRFFAFGLCVLYIKIHIDKSYF